MADLDPFFFKINSWSFTRHRVWNRCQRQYYYEYIAPYVKSNPIVNPEKIRYLKNFTSKFVVQGQLIHDIIDQQIQFACDKKPMDLFEALNVFMKKVSLYRGVGGETFTEYHNGEKIPDSFFTSIEENGKTCLHTFFAKWPEYAKRECLRHEQFDHFFIGDVGVTVKVDFAAKMPDGTIVLSDWKTGRDDDEYETELQMTAYVLWATKFYDRSADEIGTELVFLRTGATKPYAFYEEQLQDTSTKIAEEFAAINASYEYGDFPARPVQRECLSCKFAGVCPDAAKSRP
ncbi:RecB family exonuclease [Methanoregula sp.]|uniref:RecB family exonuclease n=1 Tax=Methanoregula sp. TaxID=2052170 RepID=UPI003BB1C650